MTLFYLALPILFVCMSVSESPDLSRGNLKEIYKELELISEKLKVSIDDY